MPSKIMFALSLCRKAGALVMGFDAVKDSVLSGKAQIVLCASDLSEGTRRRVGYVCEDLVELFDLPDTIEELSPICKKLTGVFAVTDVQLAALCQSSAGPKSPSATSMKEERP